MRGAVGDSDGPSDLNGALIAAFNEALRVIDKPAKSSYLLGEALKKAQAIYAPKVARLLSIGLYRNISKTDPEVAETFSELHIQLLGLLSPTAETRITTGSTLIRWYVSRLFGGQGRNGRFPGVVTLRIRQLFQRERPLFTGQKQTRRDQAVETYETSMVAVVELRQSGVSTRLERQETLENNRRRIMTWAQKRPGAMVATAELFFEWLESHLSGTDEGLIWAGRSEANTHSPLLEDIKTRLRMKNDESVIKRLIEAESLFRQLLLDKLPSDPVLALESLADASERLASFCNHREPRFSTISAVIECYACITADARDAATFITFPSILLRDYDGIAKWDSSLVEHIQEAAHISRRAATDRLDSFYEFVTTIPDDEGF
jgi:hypothetical protein